MSGGTEVRLGAIHEKAGIATSGICRRFHPKVDDRGLLVDIPSDRRCDFRPLDRIDRQSQSLTTALSSSHPRNYGIPRVKPPARLGALARRDRGLREVRWRRVRGAAATGSQPFSERAFWGSADLTGF